MSIQKKSLISSLKTTKNANVAKNEVDAKPAKFNSKRTIAKSLKKTGFANKASSVYLKIS